MTITLASTLAGLALVDSPSFGTLLVPIWLMLTPGRLHPGRIAGYLVTVAAFYFCVGVVLVLGADTALDAARRVLADIPSIPLRVGQLVLGILVIALSYRLEARARRQGDTPGRMRRWRARAMSGSGSFGGLMSLALVAAALEVATMLPYLAAVGLIADADLAPHLTGAALAGYCVVMTVPAIVLAIARIAAHDKAEPLLCRINDWVTRNSARALGWTVGGIGIGMVLNAIVSLLVDRS
ncbi:GAP family protein [Embleya sp. NBC_00896]|uniref:GAP family protein n=1 Tax=Embleya sp. NBC_00896 TaxID=2975961 RepID=UPI002F916F3D|nr:GAP family protein [Embleya sp. NBC_00896]